MDLEPGCDLVMRFNVLVLAGVRVDELVFVIDETVSILPFGMDDRFGC